VAEILTSGKCGPDVFLHALGVGICWYSHPHVVNSWDFLWMLVSNANRWIIIKPNVTALEEPWKGLGGEGRLEESLLTCQQAKATLIRMSIPSVPTMICMPSMTPKVATVNCVMCQCDTTDAVDLKRVFNQSAAAESNGMQ
jgi:hypothetical protein